MVGTAVAWTLLAQLAMTVGWLPTRVGLTTARAKEARFRTLLQASNDVIQVISDGVITAQEPAAAALGYRAEDVVGRRYTELLRSSAAATSSTTRRSGASS